eukprot:1306516-Prymnesium_polylepis.1
MSVRRPVLTPNVHGLEQRGRVDLQRAFELFHAPRAVAGDLGLVPADFIVQEDQVARLPVLPVRADATLDQKAAQQRRALQGASVRVFQRTMWLSRKKCATLWRRERVPRPVDPLHTHVTELLPHVDRKHCPAVGTSAVRPLRVAAALQSALVYRLCSTVSKGSIRPHQTGPCRFDLSSSAPPLSRGS